MLLDDTLQLFIPVVELDENLNEVDVELYNRETDTTSTQSAWESVGKCKIMPNDSAREITLEDGTSFLYSYQVYFRKPKSSYLLPTEGRLVHIHKKDGTIDAEKEVKGFVTHKNWVKIWL